jgi:hypothetical protein
VSSRSKAIELIVNGVVTQRFEPQNTKAKAGSFESRVTAQFKPDTSSWLAWRCFEKRPGNRFHFAHTAPWHFEIPSKPLRPRRAEAEWLVSNVKEEIARSRGVAPESLMSDYRQGTGSLRTTREDLSMTPDPLPSVPVSLEPPCEPPTVGTPPPLPSQPVGKSSSMRRSTLTILLSLYLGLFLLNAVVSLISDSLILLFDIHLLTGLDGTLFLFTLLATLVIYVLMGLTPMISKRLFLPLTLFIPVAALAMILFVIFSFRRIQHAACALSLCQVVLGFAILRAAQGGFRFRWPLIAEERLEARRFTWRNLWVFLLVNVFVFVPAVVAYLVYCVGLAAHHFSDGFVSLQREGFIVQARKYVRSDGTTIHLFPMWHIGEPDFYRKVSQSFPTNAIILAEGVTDDRNLLTNRISYKRMAQTLGVAEQQREFRPRSRMVLADVDVADFGQSTVDFLNLVMLIHAKGVNVETILALMQSPELHLEERFFEDIIVKRNQRAVDEIHIQLAKTKIVVVPWGAAHMPGIAKEIQKSGFRVSETQEFVAIRFGSDGSKSKSVRREADEKQK